ncbi:MAG TPA: hypothetical protein VHW23_07675 [Kofleriaceae bacterium]|jgi:hypothetical protein|nr:hypothetical protein [Kofleriaceae bacterium]
MRRQLTFIDVDENRLELWLKPDRVQLVVVDSRPELEAGELRRFASVVFAEYVARDLVDRLDAARSQLQDARDRARGGALIASLDGALRAIDQLAAVIPGPAPVAAGAEPDPADDAELDFELPAPFEPPAPGEPVALPEPAAPPEPIVLEFPTEPRPYPSLRATLRGSRKRRGQRAEEGSAIRWDATSGVAATGR